MEDLHLLTDDSLVNLFKDGENTAFMILLSRYEERLHTYIKCIVHTEDATKDILQETYVRVVGKIRSGKYVGTGRFKFWIARIAHNCMVDYCRREINDWRTVHEDSDVDIFNDPRFSDETVEDKLIRTQICNNLRRIIRFLPECQREVIFLRIYKGLSFREIALITGVSINTALGRMRYAILHMRRIIQKNQSGFVVN